MGKICLIILCLILTQNLYSQDKYMLIVKYNDSIIERHELYSMPYSNEPRLKLDCTISVNVNLLSREDIINLNKNGWRIRENEMVNSIGMIGWNDFEYVNTNFKREYKLSNNNTLFLSVQTYELDFKNKKIIFKNNLQK